MLLGFAHPLGGHASVSGLSGRPLQLTKANPLLVFADLLIVVAFKPVIFGCHLTPHDAPPRACAYCSQNCTRRMLHRGRRQRPADGELSDKDHEASGNSAYLSSCCFAQALLSSDALDTVFGDRLQDVKSFEFGVAQIERFVASGTGVRFPKLL